MNIREFSLSDQDAVIDLWQRCGLVRPQNDPRKDIARKLRVQAEMFLLAVENSTVVGSVMCGYEGHRGWINYLAVDPDRRYQGIGRGLMKRAEQVLQTAGCPKINLQVRSTNQSVIAFYRAIGFTIDEVTSMGKRLEDD